MTPNPDNYCTLEMSRRLVEAGIVLVADHYYRLWTAIDGTKCSMIVTEKEMDELSYDPDKYECDTPDVKYLPASSMAEVWRELPKYLPVHSYYDGEKYFFWRRWNNGEVFSSTNQTDALCELLIWLKGDKK